MNINIVFAGAVLCAACNVAPAVTVHTAEHKGEQYRWFEEMVPMKDGVKLYTYGVLPPDGVKCGIIFNRSPYVPQKRVDMLSYARGQRDTLKRGYAYVHQHVRGTGMSDGDWVPYVNEREDGLATLEWIRKLPHYCGEIFLQGGSYVASVHWSYLDTNPPDIKGALLTVQDVNRYNIHYRNGNYKIGLHGNWVVNGYKKKNMELKRDPSVKFTDLPLKGFSVRRLGEYVTDLEDTWQHPRPNDPWWLTPGAAGAEYRKALLNSTIPVMMITGAYDIYTEGIFDMWREMPPGRRANCALVVDAFDHGGRRPKDVDESSPVCFPLGSRHDKEAVDSALDWFDWCRGKGKLKKIRPGETLWYALWENAWHSSPEMKDAEGSLSLHFTSDRRLSTKPSDSGDPAVAFAYDPKSPPSFPGAGCLSFGGMKVQPEPNFRDDVVSFVSSPADRRYDVRGRMRLKLAVMSDCDDTTFYVRVSIRKRDGKWYTLRDDIKSILWDNADYVPGRATTVSYLLSDHAFTIEKGDSIRVDVAGANASVFVPHTNFKGPFVEQAKSRVAHNAIIPAGCALDIPVDGGRMVGGTFPLEWNVDYPTDVPYEVELIPAKFGGARSFAVRADGKALDVVSFSGKEAGSVCLRFLVPAGTKRLECETADAPLKTAESQNVDNLFAGALDASNLAKWSIPKNAEVKVTPKDGAVEFACTRGSPFVSYEVPVPEALRGSPARIELDVQSLTPMTWGGKIRFAQVAADGSLLPQSVSDPRWTSHMRPCGVKAQYRETGHIDPRAAKVRLEIELRNIGRSVDEYGLPNRDPRNTAPHIIVSHVALRAAAMLPFPKYDDGNFHAGVSGAEGDTSLALGDGRAFWYQCHSRAVWAEGAVSRTEDELFFPNAAGTAEAWFKPSEWKHPKSRYAIFEAYNGYHAAEHSRESAHSMFLLEFHPASRTFLFAVNDHYGHSWKGSARGDIPLGKWSHIAMQWTPGGSADVFMNGKKVLSVELKGYVTTDMHDKKRRWINDYQPMEFYIGARWNNARNMIRLTPEAPFFDGLVDELRVSTGLRYKDGFTPARRFAVDSDTRAHFGFNRSFDGRSGGGTEFIRGSFRAPNDRVDHVLTFADGKKLQYRAAKILPEFDPLVQLDVVNYPVMPTVEEFESAREVKRSSWRVKSGGTMNVRCESKPYTDYVEIRNVSSSPLKYPVVFNEGDLDPRSFGDLRDTLLRTKMSDRDRVNRIFNFVIKASDYFMDRQVSFKPGEDRPDIAMGDAMLMLNSYCGFECGPLNNMAANMFACSGGCLASQTGGYGHSFEQVFYDGKNHIYDLSAQSFFAAMDNESAAYLEEAGDQPGVILRTGRSPDHFIRFGHRGYAPQSPDYCDKVGVTLNPGETLRVWFGNDGWQNLLRRVPPASAKGPIMSKRNNLEWKTLYTDKCGAKTKPDDEVWRVLRKFPEFASGYLEHDSRPTADNPAFSNVTADSFTYLVKSGYQIVRGEYEAELENGGLAPLEMSSDFGKTWRPLQSPATYQVMARLEYLVRVKAPIAAVKRFRARTQLEINSRIFPGRLHAGENSLNFKTSAGGEAQVTVQWREKAKRAVVAGGAYTGAIPGWERQLFVMDPSKGLDLKVEGISDGASVVCSAGIAGSVRGGMLSLRASGPVKDGFCHVNVKDGNAERVLTVYVSGVARLAFADSASLKGDASVKAADAGRVQPCVWMEKNGDGATFRFEPLPAGKYMIYGLSRFPSRTTNVTGGSNRILAFTPPGESAPLPACGPVSIPMTYFKAEYGEAGGRGNFKWDTVNDSRQTYHVSWLMARFECPSFDHIDWILTAPRAEGVELAATLIVPAGGEEEYLDLLSNLAGLNFESLRVR